VTVTFSSVRPNQKRTGTLYFRVNDWLADNTVINMRASYRWGADESGTTNWAPVLVGPGNANASWVWMSVDPTAAWPGATHNFFSDRFVPGEGVVTWLNTPSGVKALDLRTTADSFGRARIDFKSTGLRPGTYSFVLYGARSNLTALATFYVW
jgi:hypothetical protein